MKVILILVMCFLDNGKCENTPQPQVYGSFKQCMFAGQKMIRSLILDPELMKTQRPAFVCRRSFNPPDTKDI